MIGTARRALSLVSLAVAALALTGVPPAAGPPPPDPDVRMYDTSVPRAPAQPIFILELHASAQADLPAGVELDLLVADAAGWPVSGFVEDPEYPEVTAGPGFWWKWYQYHILGEFPPSHRVFCGVTLPAFSADSSLAFEAADLVELEPSSVDPADVCNEILEHVNPSQ